MLIFPHGVTGMNKVTLRFADGTENTSPRDQAEQSIILKKLLKGRDVTAGKAIHLADISYQTWPLIESILPLLAYHDRLNNKNEIIESSLNKYLQAIIESYLFSTPTHEKPIQSYLDLIDGADYLRIPPLLTASRNAFVDYVKEHGKNFSDEEKEIITHRTIWPALLSESCDTGSFMLNIAPKNFTRAVTFYKFIINIAHQYNNSIVSEMAARELLAHSIPIALSGKKRACIPSDVLGIILSNFKDLRYNPDLIGNIIEKSQPEDSMKAITFYNDTITQIANLCYKTEGDYKKAYQIAIDRFAQYLKQNQQLLNCPKHFAMLRNQLDTMKDTTTKELPYGLTIYQIRKGLDYKSSGIMTVAPKKNILAYVDLKDDTTICLRNLVEQQNINLLSDQKAPFGPKPFGPKPFGPKLKNYVAHHDKRVSVLAFSPKGDLLASGSEDKTIKLWDPSNQKDLSLLATLISHTKTISVLSFNSTDQKILASGAEDASIRLWDLSNKKQPVLLSTITDHTTPLYSIAFSPTQKIMASGSSDDTIRIHDISNPNNPQLYATINVPSPRAENERGNEKDVVFTRDGTLVSKSLSELNVQFWKILADRMVAQVTYNTEIKEHFLWTQPNFIMQSYHSILLHHQDSKPASAFTYDLHGRIGDISDRNNTIITIGEAVFSDQDLLVLRDFSVYRQVNVDTFTSFERLLFYWLKKKFQENGNKKTSIDSDHLQRYIENIDPEKRRYFNECINLSSLLERKKRKRAAQSLQILPVKNREDRDLIHTIATKHPSTLSGKKHAPIDIASPIALYTHGKYIDDQQNDSHQKNQPTIRESLLSVKKCID
jgi:WD40 repeat protein